MQQTTFTRLLLFLVLVISLFQPAFSQTVLTGATSNGGPNGGGTVFTMNTDGSSYSLVQGFADWGKAPYGNLLKGDDGNFYGTTYNGGTYGYGTIFKMTPSGSVTVLRQFNYTTDGGYPYGELIKGANGAFYGMTSSGGANGYGTIFTLTTSGVYTVLKAFTYAADGAAPHGHLTLASDGNYYGITRSGGTYGYGAIFRLTPGNVYTVLHHMTSAADGGYSYGSLTEATDGNLYGTTYSGGTYAYGTIFKITKAGVYTVLKHLNTADGTYPQSDLVQATDGNLWGTCNSGGTNSGGTIFKISMGGVYTVVRPLRYSTDGGYPYGGLVQNTDGALYGITSGGGTTGYGVIYKITTGGAYTVLHSMALATEGGVSYSALALGNDASLYALTSTGGACNMGTAFKTSTGGTVTVLAAFNGATALGNNPQKSVIKGKDSAYYVMNSKGGAYGAGCVVKICGGMSSILYSFNKAASGGTPKGNLLQASDGNFYGTTYEGGSNGYGTIFRLTPGGVLTVLRSLASSTDGGYSTGSLIQGADGLLYGTCSGGGSGSNGTLFKISTAGAFTLLHSFVYATDGGTPSGDLVQANDGNFYGMTTNGSRIFKMKPDGTFSILFTLTSATGYIPYGSLIQATDGNLYGTGSDGGSGFAGSVFQVSLTGVCKVIKSFTSTTDGRAPKGTLLQGRDGMLYGTTSIGGTYNQGTVFKLSTGGAFTVLRQLNMDKDGGNAYGNLIFCSHQQPRRQCAIRIYTAGQSRSHYINRHWWYSPHIHLNCPAKERHPHRHRRSPHLHAQRRFLRKRFLLLLRRHRLYGICTG